ncbi:MAG: A/G-specific adenine glycosylase [Burkholderiaceae bacterium]|nr:A/G-specific adenine glycosylase [Burkholderiaceae bacterium]
MSTLTSPTQGTPSARQMAHFAPTLVAWQAEHGRHHLPWQRTQDPYHVWLSEIMLQQTQVSTVLDYFERFLAALPSVVALAAAPQEQVMALWAGLGYYSRARNLHRCAQEVVARFGGEFPPTAAQLETLPGIGPSTAAAIASFCFGERISIYDGNVKRVLSRLLAFDGDLSGGAANKLLHAHAQALVVGSGQAMAMPRYTQGLMDLGATVCHLKAPNCGRCPVREMCAAHAADEAARYPIKTKRIKRTSERWYLLLLDKGDAVWLQQRGDAGIWGGLQAPLVFSALADMARWLQLHGGMLAVSGPSQVSPISQVFGASPELQALQLSDLVQPTIKHQLTHKELFLTPVVVPVAQAAGPLGVGEAGEQYVGAWVDKSQLAQAALPAPIKKWLLAAG